MQENYPVIECLECHREVKMHQFKQHQREQHGKRSIKVQYSLEISLHDIKVIK